MTTTDRTVPVPIDLLQKIKERYPVATDEFDYLTDLVALIPDPPKVGDVLTAEQIKALPDSAVMRDEDGDVLVKVRNTVRRATIDLDGLDQTDWIAGQIDGLVATYCPITLVSLPTPRD